LQPFLQGAVFGGELADALLERGVLGGDPLRGLLGPFLFQVAELAREVRDPVPLGADLGVGGVQGGLGVERAFPPACLLLCVCLGQRLRPPLGGTGNSLAN
jgi:hypothetical protein